VNVSIPLNVLSQLNIISHFISGHVQSLLTSRLSNANATILPIDHTLRSFWRSVSSVSESALVNHLLVIVNVPAANVPTNLSMTLPFKELINTLALVAVITLSSIVSLVTVKVVAAACVAVHVLVSWNLILLNCEPIFY